MNDLNGDIKIYLLFKYYLDDRNALQLFKTCKTQYKHIALYKYKTEVYY